MEKQISNLRQSIKSVFPQLTSKLKKGDNGRVGVIGGSFQYTGAPYYTAVSALKAGSDLSHIFCSKSSAIPIKSYSPQIIVHPLFSSQKQITDPNINKELIVTQWVQQLRIWYKAIDVWVIGPGLGRDALIAQFLYKILQDIPKQIPLIIDADGIYHLCQNSKMFITLRKRQKVFLTPNIRQMTYLNQHFSFNMQQTLKLFEEKGLKQIDGSRQIIQYKLNNELPSSLFIKGFTDFIIKKGNSQFSFIVKEEGSLKRCGGIGDILSGVLAVLALRDWQYGPILASIIVKLASKRAYEIQKRGLTAPSVIKQLTKSAEFIQESYKGNYRSSI